MCDVDWSLIRQDYISSSMSQREIADKYGLSKSLIGKVAKKEKWAELRGQTMGKAIAKQAEKVADAMSGAADRLVEIYTCVLEEIPQAIEDERAAKGRVTLASLNNAMEAIGRYQEGMGIVLGHNAEKAKAELDKLHRELEEGNTADRIVVQMEGIGDLIG